MTYGETSTRYKKSERTVIVKFNLTPSESKVFDMKLKKVSKTFSEKDLLLNQIELLRVIALNLDSPELVDILTKLYKVDASRLFVGAIK